jgi:hypothetical protein
MHRLTMAALIVCCAAGCDPRTPIPSTESGAEAQSQIAAATAPAARVTTQTPSPAPSATPSRTPSATPTPDPNVLLPDLQTLPPFDLVIEFEAQGERRLLRFSNSILNRGSGALELLGQLNPNTGKTAVTQHIYRNDGALDEHAAGEFVFHPGHDHWHLANFALYEVWSLTPEGRLNRVLTFTDKISYCLRDNSRSDIAGAAARATYARCNRALQGISVGWIDTYEFDTPGQIVDITAVPNGIYAVRSTVDPDNQLRESNDANNSAVTYIELTGNRVRVIDNREALRQMLDLQD